MTQRKEIDLTISAIDRVKTELTRKETQILNISEEGVYREKIDYLTSLIKKCERKKKKLPLGNVFKGTFYINRPYAVPQETIKINGSAYMREDLVTWQLMESDNELTKHLCGPRDIFRDSERRIRITREECEPVYADTKN
jgi:hypothetical protein